MRARSSVGMLAALVALLAPAAPASAGTVPINPFGRAGDMHLDFPTYASAPAQDSSYRVSPPRALLRPAGDMNGDARADLAMAISGDGDEWPSTAWVTFTPAVAQWSGGVEGPGWSGLRIDGVNRSISGLAGLGDVNADGFGDLAVAAVDQGAWVIYGGPASATVDVRNLGARGFAITGVSPCPASGGGNFWTGELSRQTSVAGLGDHDGDGRPEIAICESGGVRIVHPPAEPGSSIDAGTPDATSSRVRLPVYDSPLIEGLDPAVGVRTDLVVGWRQDDGPHVAELPPPAPGRDLTMTEALESPSASELVAADRYIERLSTVGDQNGDGRRDLTVSLAGSGGREVFVAYSPPPGTHRALAPLTPEVGHPAYGGGSGITDVGDQDGDGRADLAFDGAIQLSSTGEFTSIADGLPQCVLLEQRGPSAALVLCALEHKIAATLPDGNGDGKPELVAIYADPLPVQSGVTRATWRLDVYPSAVNPVPEVLDAPVALPGEVVDFSGTFVTAPHGPLQTLAARPSITVTDAGGRTSTVAGELLDAGAAKSTRATVRASAARLGLKAGGTYGFRLSLENGRGLTGTSATKTFTYRPPSAVPPKTEPTKPTKPARLRGRRLVGTRHGDRLRGTRAADVLRGGRGADVLRGLGGADRLDGGPGADRLDGGRGRDQLRGRSGRDALVANDGERDFVDCGSGRDAAVVDRRDVVRRCERVKRRPPRR
ncbi:MAG TPA: hypothetical protein VF533_16810 [Solirubrobacteraceae bacterium]